MIYTFNNLTPAIPDSAFLAPSADVIGDVTLGEEVSIWFGTVLRGDMNSIRIGARTNIQDNATVHVTTGTGPTVIGNEVTVGHNAIVHGCTIEACCLIGMGSTIIDGSHVGEGSIIAAGTVLTPGTVVPPRSLYAGIPGKFHRAVTDQEYEQIIESANHYIKFAQMLNTDEIGLVL